MAHLTFPFIGKRCRLYDCDIQGSEHYFCQKSIGISFQFPLTLVLYPATQKKKRKRQFLLQVHKR